jgi:hypothetical protein
MKSNTSVRPNRVVTCQVCGTQMPQRYLPAHLMEHAAVKAELPPEMAESTVAEVAAAPEKEHSGSMVCPACSAFVAEEEFAHHMLVEHMNWCPLCLARTKDLAGHLSSRHRLKPILPAPDYQRNWQIQKRFICLQCKKKVSVVSYPRHERPHSTTPGPASQAETGR